MDLWMDLLTASCLLVEDVEDVGLSENVGLIFPIIIGIFHRDNDQQNHWL